MSRKARLETPDGRYLVSRGRLWRKTNPCLSDIERRAAIKLLMQARLGMRKASSELEVMKAKADVDAAKQRLGETGPVWWSDGAPDESGRHPLESSYAAWWAELSDEDKPDD